MPTMAPAMGRISSGMAVPAVSTIFRATGSTSRCHAGSVPSTHSARLHAADGRGAGRQRRGPVQPHLGEPYGVVDGAPLRVGDRAVTAGRDRLARRVVRELPVDRPALVGEQLAELLQGRADVRRSAGTAAEEGGKRVVWAEGAARTGTRRVTAGLVGVIRQAEAERSAHGRPPRVLAGPTLWSACSRQPR